MHAKRGTNKKGHGTKEEIVIMIAIGKPRRPPAKGVKAKKGNKKT
jgi:hypothetical protein